jgi:hypothetical protein
MKIHQEWKKCKFNKTHIFVLTVIKIKEIFYFYHASIQLIAKNVQQIHRNVLYADI